MLVNREAFYSNVRANGLFGKMSQHQVDSINAVFDEWDKQQLTDFRWLAYMLATIYHETDKTMMPIEEYGHGKTRPYGQKLKHSGLPYKTPDKIYYGRGFVQLTWYENYELMSRLLHIDLLNNPEKALELPIAVAVLFEGMLRGSSSMGDFTGKCLEQYFNDTTEDWANARRIINGTDKAQTIADYAQHFYKSLILNSAV